jgi:hypothetical protein
MRRRVMLKRVCSQYFWFPWMNSTPDEHYPREEQEFLRLSIAVDFAGSLCSNEQ